MGKCESRTQFYHHVPKLAAVTVVSCSYHTPANACVLFLLFPLLFASLKIPKQCVIVLLTCPQRCMMYFVLAPTHQFRATPHIEIHYVKQSLPYSAHSCTIILSKWLWQRLFPRWLRPWALKLYSRFRKHFSWTCQVLEKAQHYIYKSKTVQSPKDYKMLHTLLLHVDISFENISEFFLNIHSSN